MALQGKVIPIGSGRSNTMPKTWWVPRKEWVKEGMCVPMPS